MQAPAEPLLSDVGPSPKQRIHLHTFGCQMNVLDSQLVREALTAVGYRFVSEVDDADVVLINTCSVRALSEQKVWSMLGRLAKLTAV